MDSHYPPQIASELNTPLKKVEAVIELLDGGATVPFISRYRKEATGSLDEVAVTKIRDRLGQLRELDKRRATVLASIKEQKKLTPPLEKKILAAPTLRVLEDIYLPFKPKRRTRATVAREKGLEPLAKLLFEQCDINTEKEAKKFIDPKKKVKSVEDALAGARDIIAEWVNEQAAVRQKMRSLYFEKGVLHAKVIRGKESEGRKYKDYFDWQEKVKGVPSHRMLAVRRAEKEKVLALKILVPEKEAMAILEEHFIKKENAAAEQVRLALADSFKRLLSLSIETEVRLAAKEKADQEAIVVFTKNLRELLMTPPLGQQRVMAIDPGYRTGCKVVCLDEQGQLLHFETVYPTDAKKNGQDKLVRDLCAKYDSHYVAIGNGTASRETEAFIHECGLPEDVQILVVSESGASIYSASEVAREEFPKHDVTVRGAVSIGRRLMDPLAELVKIDPKSIGVGQYQHDVDQKLLKQSLDDVVISCVNQVGVELNTASKQLLTYVSGLGAARAQKIIEYRNEHGHFQSREQLDKIAGLGPKAVEQAAGFLRIRDGKNPLDASAVHPESYVLVEEMAKDQNCTVRDLMKKEELRTKLDLNTYANETIGLPTLNDILNELTKPGRDPRAEFQVVTFKEGVLRPDDLRPGMKLPGIVTNVTRFGAFVDVGVHLDGLVHISQLSERYIHDPGDVVKVHQPVQVTVLQVDLQRKRIALSMKANPEIPG